MSHAPLIVYPHYVILCFKVVTPLGVGTSFSQGSALGCLWYLCVPGALYTGELNSLVYQSCLKNFGAKSSVNLTFTSTASGVQHHEISSDKTKCCPLISSCLVLNNLQRKNVCACFEKFGAKYLHLNPPQLAITFFWELAGVTVPALCHFFTNSCLWIWGLLELDNLGVRQLANYDFWVCWKNLNGGIISWKK